MSGSFPISVVMPDGGVVRPPGWMFVLSFALCGVDWAVKKVVEPEWLEVVREHLDTVECQTFRRRQLEVVDKCVKRVVKLKEELHIE